MTILRYISRRPWYWFLTGTPKCRDRWCPLPRITDGPWHLFSAYCRAHTDERVARATR